MAQVTSPTPQALELVSLRQPEPTGDGREVGTLEKIRHLARRNLAFLILVALPTVIAAIYLYGFAAGRYESQATFVVRSPSGNAVSQIARLVQGSGVVSSPEDAYVVGDYIASRDAMHDLLKNGNLLEIFKRPEADFFWRYPNPLKAQTDENLYLHYLRFVSVSFDKTTGISTLRVEAFRPEDARELSNTLLKNAETLLNRLNVRAQEDAIVTALQQVDQAKERAHLVQDRVTNFRKREGVIDPGRFSTSVLTTIARLSLEMARTNAELDQIMRSSPQSPQIGSLRLRISALEAQINKERTQLAGANNSFAPLLAEYDRLMLERTFAEKAFTSALDALEIARVDAKRQGMFLERITNPYVADYAKYPYRLIWVVVVFALAMMLYWSLRTFAVDTLLHAKK